MNFIIIMTDTQNHDMVGAYGNPAVDTPHLDQLAAEGIRFDRAYTTCPLCTPARSALFSGTHPTVNGAWCNNVPPYPTVPLMGTIFKHHGYRTAYTGKWHLDGSGYFGDGEPGGGFEPDWWYDGKRYAEDVGDDIFHQYRTGATLNKEDIWGHRVADQAINFLNSIHEEPFVLVVSFDEPHGPYSPPEDYQKNFDIEGIPMRPNFGASPAGKPRLQQIHRDRVWNEDETWEQYQKTLHRHFSDNAYIDSEIGRVLTAAKTMAPGETTVIYTSDHGDMQGSHGLKSKGPMMYEEITHIPLLIKTPDGVKGKESSAVASHLDILPTMLDLADLPCPESMQGVSLCPVLADTEAQPRTYSLMSFTRFAVNHDDWGEFYPIRCITDGNYKLVINLNDSDEFYDLQKDPYEITNLIGQPNLPDICATLHDALLDEMDRIRDPFRSYLWGDREWRSVRTPFYHGGKRRNPPHGFPFQPVGIEADGTRADSHPPIAETKSTSRN